MFFFLRMKLTLLSPIHKTRKERAGQERSYYLTEVWKFLAPFVADRQELGQAEGVREASGGHPGAAGQAVRLEGGEEAAHT